MEGDKLGRRKLFARQPSLGSILFGIWAPDLCISAHGPRAPANLFALVDFDTTGQHIVLDTNLDVLRDGRVKTESLIETGFGVLLMLGRLVRGQTDRWMTRKRFDGWTRGRLFALGGSSTQDTVGFLCEFSQDLF